MNPRHSDKLLPFFSLPVGPLFTPDSAGWGLLPPQGNHDDRISAEFYAAEGASWFRQTGGVGKRRGFCIFCQNWWQGASLDPPWNFFSFFSFHLLLKKVSAVGESGQNDVHEARITDLIVRRTF